MTAPSALSMTLPLRIMPDRRTQIILNFFVLKNTFFNFSAMMQPNALVVTDYTNGDVQWAHHAAYILHTVQVSLYRAAHQKT